MREREEGTAWLCSAAAPHLWPGSEGYSLLQRRDLIRSTQQYQKQRSTPHGRVSLLHRTCGLARSGTVVVFQQICTAFFIVSSHLLATPEQAHTFQVIY